MPLTEQMMAILVVFALLATVVWLLKRKGYAQFGVPRLGSSRRKRLESLERLALTPQHSLHLVRVADRVILLGVSPSGCNLLNGPAIPEIRPAEDLRS